MTTREAMEAALLDDPDDLVRHAVYADMLIEDGDPRGDYIRMQLQLEDEMLAADRRKELESQSAAILKQHEREWLGPLDWLRPKTSHFHMTGTNFRWRRGWINWVSLHLTEMTYIRNLIDAPLTKLLTSLNCFRCQTDACQLIAKSHWSNLRGLEFDYLTSFDPVVTLASNVSLHRLTSLSFLMKENIEIQEQFYWLEVLCGSRFFPSLDRLFLSQVHLSDDSVDTILSSGILKKLSVLSLNGNNITDDGALALAAHPDVANLKYLSLSNNLLTAIGIEALVAVGHYGSFDQRFGRVGTLEGDL